MKLHHVGQLHDDGIRDDVQYYWVWCYDLETGKYTKKVFTEDELFQAAKRRELKKARRLAKERELATQIGGNTYYYNFQFYE